EVKGLGRKKRRTARRGDKFASRQRKTPGGAWAAVGSQAEPGNQDQVASGFLMCDWPILLPMRSTSQPHLGQIQPWKVMPGLLPLPMTTLGRGALQLGQIVCGNR